MKMVLKLRLGKFNLKLGWKKDAREWSSPARGLRGMKPV